MPETETQPRRRLCGRTTCWVAHTECSWCGKLRHSHVEQWRERCACLDAVAGD
jgi:hypothetical protein